MPSRIGCCGFGQARAKYFEQFGVVEVQKTFYDPPRPQTLKRWREEAPDGFEFTLKAWQVITHPAASPTYRRMRHPPKDPDSLGFFQDSGSVRAAWDRTREAARCLDAGIVLFQCPASFTPEGGHIDQMRAFFAAVPRDGLAFVWEPRGEGWTDDLVHGLCEDLNLMHGVDPLQRRPVHGDFAYFRMHGRTGYRYRHTDADLREIASVAAPHDTSYCLFNNMSMLEDAARFRHLVGA